MGDYKPSSKRTQSTGANRNNPPRPPPPQRKHSKGKSNGQAEVSGPGRSSASKSSSSRTREVNNTSGQSKSRKQKPTEDENGQSRSRGKSRPREATKESSRRPSSENKSKPRDSRSKSRPRQSPKSKPQDDKRPSPKRQQSKKSNTKSRSAQNGARSSPKKQPSSKRREKYANAAQKAIPASVRMISGSHDCQTSADVSNISSQFQLPKPAGRSGGACTAALLQVLYQSHDDGNGIMWVDVLRQMRDVLEDKGFDQIPQLTSSRMIDVRDPFLITPTDGSFNHKDHTQRAVLIGINYTGQNGELSGCHNDVLNVNKYLIEVQGFRKENVTILMDDGQHKAPTKSAILTAYRRLVRESKEGDVVFCHYSGHGGRLADDNGDEEDGYDETLIPVDFEKSGQIRDDDLLKKLIHPMAEGVNMTCLMDCCHSGTVLDLPYRFTADGDIEEMEMNERTNFKDALYEGMGLGAGMAAGSMAVSAIASAVAPPAPEMMILGGGPNAIHEHSDTDCCVVS